MTDYSKIEIVKNIIVELLKQTGFANVNVSYEESITKGLVFNLGLGTDSYLLIGRQGSTLHAFQVLCGQIAEKQLKEPFYFTVDVDDYKMKREWFLKETARAAVEHIKKTGRPVALEPMPNYERRLIHAYIQENHLEAISESIGEDSYRRVVIRLKR